MKKLFSELFRFIHRFGAPGAFLYFKIKVMGHRKIIVPGIRFPFFMRKGSSDYETFYQAIVHNQYKFKYGILPKIIIDGGANIGLASIAFKNMFPEALIVAVEPDEANYIQLRENVKPYANIFPIHAGLWSKKGFLKVTDKYNLGKWGMVTEEVPSGEMGNIATLTISEILQNFNIETIDILKLDIETAERELFSSNYEAWLPRVKIIVIELHDGMSSGTAKPFFTAINRTFNEYAFFQLGENTIIINKDFELEQNINT